jgi:hypothetical protein
MKTGIRYGLLLAVLLFLLERLESRVAWTAYWAWQAIFLAIFAKLTWQRTGMFWIALMGADAALFSAALVPASLAGYTIATLPSPWMTIMWVNVGALAALHTIGTFVHRKEFERWKRHEELVSLWDSLRFRHIPYLR